MTVLLILLQINKFNSKYEIYIIYLEIIILYLGLRMISCSTVGFTGIFGLDNYYELDSVNLMLNSGHWLPYANNVSDTVSGYPASHFLGSFLSLITDIKIEHMLIIISLIIQMITLFIFILISKIVLKDDKITLISTLGFIFTFLFVYMNFGRMIISIALFFIILFLIIRNENQKLSFSFLIILSMITLIYSHPLAPAILTLFLCSFLVFKIAYKKNFSSKIFQKIKLKRDNINSNLFLLLSILVCSYFVYISLWQQDQFLDTINMLKGLEASQKVGTATETPLNMRIFLLGQLFLGLLFMMIFIKYRKNVKNFDIAFFMTFGGILGIISALAYLVKLDILRFTIFLWPLIILAFSYLFKQSKNLKIFYGIIILFISINMTGYYIDSYDSTYEIPPGAWRMYVNEQETAAIEIINPNGYIISNHYIKMAALKTDAVNLPQSSNFYFEGYKDPNNYRHLNYFFFEKEDMKSLFIRGAGKLSVTSEDYIGYQQSMQRIYDNGEVESYKILN